ncbi:MAG TPA: alpha/beta hydrolase-fold protein [Chitinophagaceae bacterium]|nr:alpha/beta hydrolase-fold protein [Chitinophagaceae bacterium]
MIRSIIVIVLLLITTEFISGQSQVHFEIRSFPSYQSPNSEIFLAGSLNGWNPQDKNFQFNKDDQGNYFLDSKLANGSYQFKITRGSWDKVECTAGGAELANRTINVNSDTTIIISIDGWKDHFPSIILRRNSTAGKNVHVLDSAFWIPQLHRKRRVWIYLPDGYAFSKRRYPVLYMHDGQNVFDDATSYSGEWGVDECLDTMTKKCIVVAVDNGQDKRLNEYCPYDFSLTGIAANSSSNKGEGNQYVNFLVKTLKPFIDKKYRTLPDRNHTFIAGSSMGGLISMYAILKYPDVFGGAGVFSPAFWIGPQIFSDIKTKGKAVHSKIYFYAGKKESESMVQNMLKAMEGMNKVSHSKMTAVIRDDGKHNEQTWRKEFPLFYQWLMN